VFLNSGAPNAGTSLAAGHAIGFYVNLALLAITLIGFGFSVVNRAGAR
jgi:hypothetical protein